jgi:hypothetical protein
VWQSVQKLWSYRNQCTGSIVIHSSITESRHANIRAEYEMIKKHRRVADKNSELNESCTRHWTLSPPLNWVEFQTLNVPSSRLQHYNFFLALCLAERAHSTKSGINQQHFTGHLMTVCVTAECFTWFGFPRDFAPLNDACFFETCISQPRSWVCCGQSVVSNTRSCFLWPSRRLSPEWL